MYLDRADQGRTPRFVTGESPTEADIAAVITKISYRVIRKLRQLGYLKAGLDAAVATGDDPLGDDAPELVRTMAASVQQRIAFGERSGQKMRRIGSGVGSEGEPAHRQDQLERLAQDAHGDLVYTFTHPWSDVTTGIRLSPVELLEKLAALVPLPQVHLVRYGGWLAPHSHLRGAIIPTPRQQGMEEHEDSTASLHWSWARLLKRVFALDMGRCGSLPRLPRGRSSERSSAMWNLLRPPIAPARSRQEAFDWIA